MLVPKTSLRSVGPAATVVPEAVISRGIALTNDGWIAFDGAIRADGLIAVTGDGRVSPISQIVTDSATGIAFGKLAIGSFPSPDFARPSGLRAGDTFFVALGRGRAVPISVADQNAAAADRPEDKVINSETFSRRVAVVPALGKEARGAPVFNQSGALAGVLIGERGDVFVPMHFISPALPQLFRTGAVHRPYLGARGADITGLVRLPESFPRRGVLLVEASGKPAIRPASPAAKAGLRVGDVLIEVDGEALLPGAGLAEALLDFEPGDKIVLTALRGNDRLSLPVTLGDTAETR